MPPKIIGPYRVLDALGSGGVGTVYRARDQRTGEAVALKLLSTGPALDARAARRLAREFEALVDLSHPNVVRVFETGVFQGYPYLTMELIEGLTLRHYLALLGEGQHEARLLAKAALVSMPNDEAVTGEWDLAPFSLEAFAAEMPSEDGGYVGSGPESIRALADVADEPDTHPSEADADLPFDVQATLRAMPAAESEQGPPPNLHDLNRAERIGKLKDSMMQLCRALSYIHGHGLVHRDLKPSNVMVDEDRQVRLMDFGLAKFLADDASVVTGDGRLVGTFRYMSPEQIMGEPVDPRADLYSLGIILYELLSGRPPFDGKTPYELWQKVVETDAAPLLTVNPLADEQLVRVAHKLIRKDPQERFQTAEEVYEALAE